MILPDVLRLKRMPRQQFIHYVKDVLFVALERTGGTNEFATIIELIMEDAEPMHKGTMKLQLEILYDWTHHGRK